MGKKTTKVAEELHRRLRIEAAKQDRTLQDLLEEILENALEEGSHAIGQRTKARVDRGTDQRGNDKDGECSPERG